MDKNFQYYTNRNKYQNICIPKREGILNYLIKEKFLSEFRTTEEKNRVLDNLGITQEIDYLLQLISERATLQELNRYVTMVELLRKLEEIKPKDEKSKGYFSSYNQLIQNYPIGQTGDWAIVNVNGDWYIYRYTEGIGWEQSETYDNSIDLTEYSKFSDLRNLQNILESNIQGVYSNLEQSIQNLQEQIGHGGEDIPENIGQELATLHEGLQNETDRAQNKENSLDNRLRNIEDNPPGGLYHRLISQKQYDALQSYEKNTLYLIVDFTENTSVFGDTFPLILGGEIDASQFGDTFPFVLGGDNSNKSSRFGGTFPLTFGEANYYVGSRFPIKFKQ